MGERQLRKKTKAKAKKTPIIIAAIIIISLILGASAYTAYSYSEVKKWNDIIYPGVAVGDIDISGDTKEEALNKLKSNISDKVNGSKITINMEGKSYELPMESLGFEYNFEEIVDEAFSFGKDQKLFGKYSLIKNPSDKKIDYKYSYNEEAIDAFVQRIANDLNKESKNATIAITGSNIKVTDDIKGYKVNGDAIKESIKAKLSEGITDNITLEGSGEVVVANITGEALRKIDTKISSYTTNYSTSTAGRAYNVELSAKSINGTLLMPGEVFSYNQVVGERTASRGYKEAGVYVGNKVEQGIGGGICQTSSALYVAAMSANLRSVSRTNHSMTVSYMPAGMDATVNWGTIDYQFKNNYDFPVYIQTVTANRNLTISFYGNGAGMEGKTYKLISQVVQTIEPSTKVIEDETMNEGTTSWDTKPVTGYVAKSYLVTYQNGAEINREAISTDKYIAVNGVMRKGTKKVEVKEEKPAEDATVTEKPAETPAETPAP
ncbi:VanW family protein [Alloiococcus sp. CFN-8]|uniref:VanW family protein n=1 Tax=Alloiococcus sp. CFN-8 TaxID=3416081 RepID=UPI003CE915E6